MSNQNQGMPYMMNQMYPNNYGMQGINYNNPPMGNLEPPKRDRLRVQLTSEERGFYSGLFQIADRDGKGKLVGKEAADFLKKSGLSKEVLKTIWLISAQTDPQHLERDEFYIALRLIALAQSKMECSEESIRLNHPLPPMPKFDLKSSFISSSVNQSMDGSRSSMEIDSFSLNEDDLKKYNLLFNKNKDMEIKMSINKAFQMWTTAGVSNDIMKKILSIVPLQDKTCLNFNEFKVIFHLIYKSLQTEIPCVLPNSLKKVLEGENNNDNNNSTNKDAPKKNSEINFGEKLGMNITSLNTSNSLNNSNATTNLNTNINMISNSNNNFSPIPQKTNERESLLMNEFNLKQNNADNSSQINNFSITQSNYQKPVTPNSPPVIPNNSSMNPQLQSLSINVNENFNNIHKEVLQENKFLNKVLDEDNILLNNILDDIEKITRSINLLNDKNKLIKDQITETRRKINIERDNMGKLALTLNQKSNELISNQDELLKTMDTYNNFKLESSSNALINNKINYNTMMNNNANTNTMMMNNNVNSNINVASFSSSRSNNTSITNLNLNKDKEQQISPNSQFYNNAIDSRDARDNKSFDPALNKTEFKEFKENKEFNFPNAKVDLCVDYPNSNSNPTQNTTNIPNMNNNFNFSNPKPLPVNKFDFDSDENKNTSAFNLPQPSQNTFNPPSQNTFNPPSQNTFNPPSQNTFNPPSQNTFNPPSQNTFNPPSQNNFTPPSQNNPTADQATLQRVTTDFDFDGFNEFPSNSFKEFAEKKGDDIFKKTTDFNVNWDDF